MSLSLFRQASSSDGNFIARHVSLRSGIPIDKPALHVNRLCGSGFQSIINGIQVRRPAPCPTTVNEREMCL